MKDNVRARGLEARTSIMMITSQIAPHCYIYMVKKIFTNSILEVLELHAVGRRNINTLTKVA